MKRGSFLFHVVFLLVLSAGMACNVQAQEKKKKTFKEKLIHFLDSSNVSGTDPAYIGLPEKKWMVTLNSTIDQQDMKMETSKNYISDNNYLFGLRVKPPVGTSVGFYAAYRGWGVGYSFSLTGNKGTNLSLNIATPSNGVNIRVRSYEFDKPEAGFYDIYTEGVRQPDDVFIPSEDFPSLDEPMKVESFSFDGYWIFNKKRFSLAAAYGQSVLQKRSAGSLIAGAMFYYQKYDLTQTQNSHIVEFLERIGKLKMYQASIGLGYTYNWVPTKGLLVNAVVMPVLTLLNKVDAYKYKPKFLVDPLPEGDDRDDYIVMNHIDTDHSNGHIRVNLDARCSVTYWFRNWFVTAMAQGTRYSTKYDRTSIRTTDWDVKAAVGITF